MRSVGVTDHKYYPRLARPHEYYYVTATLLGDGEEVEIEMSGDLDDQCVCSLPAGGWSDALGQPRATFIRLAMKYCYRRLGDRIYLAFRKYKCSSCGAAYGILG